MEGGDSLSSSPSSSSSSSSFQNTRGYEVGVDDGAPVEVGHEMS